MDKFIGGQSFLLVLVVTLGGYRGAIEKGKVSCWALSQLALSALPKSESQALHLACKAKQELASAEV